MSYRIVKQFQLEDHGHQKFSFGDINRDGFMEFVFAQAYPMNREICAITAVDMDGNILWRHGNILDYCDYAYSDIPFQVIDWDDDGQQEVLYVRQTKYTKAKGFCYSKHHNIIVDNPDEDMLRFNNHDFCPELALEYDGPAYLVVLDGSTGNIKEEIPIPATADDSFLFGHFENSGKWNVLVKDRYWNMYALDHEGNVLWHLNKYKHNVFFGHNPALGDIDGDGLDEIFITDTLFDHDGSIIWQIPNIEGHHDAAYILDMLAEPVIITIADKLRMISPAGEIMWEQPGGHLQEAYLGKLYKDPKYGLYQIITIDICPSANDYNEGLGLMNENPKQGQRTTLYDFYGNVIWSEIADKQQMYRVINWCGDHDCILHRINNDMVEIKDLVNGTAEIIQKAGAVTIANLVGDIRDELIFTTKGNVCIIMNTDAYNIRRYYNRCEYQQTL